MRLPYGTLTDLAKETGLPARYLSDLANCHKRPGAQRALKLEKASEKIGRKVTAMQWLYADAAEIKAALVNGEN